MKKFLKLGLKLALIGALLSGGLYFWSVKYVSAASDHRVYDQVDDIPKNKVGLVLGCNKTVNGRPNLFYNYRMDAAAKLYKLGKVEYLLVSGDNGKTSYDEPSTMKDDLVAKGVPENKIYLDYAGFRTLDSVVRCKEVFGQTEFTVISQGFHNKRAISIGKWKDIPMVGFNAKSPQGSSADHTYRREKLARVKMMIDLLTGKSPKFLGRPVKIG